MRMCSRYIWLRMEEGVANTIVKIWVKQGEKNSLVAEPLLASQENTLHRFR